MPLRRACAGWCSLSSRTVAGLPPGHHLSCCYLPVIRSLGRRREMVDGCATDGARGRYERGAGPRAACCYGDGAGRRVARPGGCPGRPPCGRAGCGRRSRRPGWSPRPPLTALRTAGRRAGSRRPRPRRRSWPRSTPKLPARPQQPPTALTAAPRRAAAVAASASQPSTACWWQCGLGHARTRPTGPAGSSRPWPSSARRAS